MNISELRQDSGNQNSAIMYVWRGINLLMVVFFCLAASVNANDADWFLWIPIYVVSALMSLPLVFRPDFAETKIWNYSTVIHFTLCCAYAIYEIVMVVEILSNKIVNPLVHEEGRELGGLLIIITWLGISRFTNIGRPGKKVSSRGYMSALILMMITLTILPLFIWSLCFVSDWHTKLAHCTGMFS